MPSIKKELLVAFLLFATLTTVLANHLVRRNFEISPGGNWSCDSSDDRNDGGNSIGQCHVEGSSFKLRYDIDDKFHSPYAIIGFRPLNKEIFDLGWAEVVRIKVRASHAEHLLFQVRSFDPAFTDKNDPVSRKYNEALLRVRPEFTEIVLDMEDFSVPSWWLARYGSKGANAKVDLSEAEWVELTTQSRSGSGSIHIESISFEGHWISTATMYRYLLWFWLSVAFVGLLIRVHNLRAELVSKRQIQEQLSETNSQLELKSEKYSAQARRDSLTGLMNRLGIHECLQECMNQNGESNFSVILFDLDHFKRINDEHGHLYGDEVLCDIAKIASRCLSGEDMIARWGGDEFLVVRPGTGKREATDLAEELRKQFANSQLRYTCSFGISESESAIDFLETFRLADEALYRSKADGRDKVKQSDCGVAEVVSRST